MEPQQPLVKSPHARHFDEAPADYESIPDGPPPRGVRMRVGLGAGVVLVLLAGGLAVLITVVSSHPAAASTTSGAGSYGSSSTESTPAASDDSVDDATGSSDEPGGGSATGSSTDFVQVVGQVEKPGVYELPAGDRIIDAIAAAGGFTPTADPASLNLAQVIADGQQLVVGVAGSATAASTTGTAGTAAGASGIVDINTADATALETLNGIGPALAQRILAYRTAHGGFRSVNDLQNVTGIGPKKFEAIKASVSV